METILLPTWKTPFADRDIPSLFATARRRAWRFLLPAVCATCETALRDDPVPFFCRRCWDQIAPLEGPSCPRCHVPFASMAAISHSPAQLCGDCRRVPPAFTEAWALYPYIPPLQEAICLFKYKGKLGLVDWLAALMCTRLPQSLDVDLIMPVPLHPVRLREREFNQSLLLADRLSRHLRVPLSYTNLVRAVPTDAQTSLTRQARLKNLRKAFLVTSPDDLQEKRILLVDDVYTTGTTVNECAKVLRRAGSGPVSVVTLARTLDPSLVRDSQLDSRTVANLADVKT
jgi:ComF family protein